MDMDFLEFIYFVYLNNIMNKEYDITVKEPWFTLIKMKLKSVEGRLNKGLFSKFKKDDIVNWVKITRNI